LTESFLRNKILLRLKYITTNPMLTDKDIKRLIDAHKEVFPTKDDFENLRKDFSELQTSVVNFATGTQNNENEIKIVNHRVDDHEKWIQKASPKIGIDFKP
jgi:hypothetical protein